MGRRAGPLRCRRPGRGRRGCPRRTCARVLGLWGPGGDARGAEAFEDTGAVRPVDVAWGTEAGLGVVAYLVRACQVYAGVEGAGGAGEGVLGPQGSRQAAGARRAPRPRPPPRGRPGSTTHRSEGSRPRSPLMARPSSRRFSPTPPGSAPRFSVATEAGRRGAPACSLAPGRSPRITSANGAPRDPQPARPMRYRCFHANLIAASLARHRAEGGEYGVPKRYPLSRRRMTTPAGAGNICTDRRPEARSETCAGSLADTVG